MDASLIIMILGPLVSGFATYVFARRKNTADAETSELDNVNKVATIWRTLATDLEQRFSREIGELRKDNEQLKGQVEKMSDENVELRKKMKLLDAENKKLIEQLTIFNAANVTKL